MTTEKHTLFDWRILTAWPIWLRVMVSILLATLIPTLGAFVVFDQAVNIVDRENLEGYVADVSYDKIINLQYAFNRASTEIAAFTESDLTYATVVAILKDEAIDFKTTNNLINYLNDQLIGSGIFSEVRLLSPEGMVNLSIQRSLGGFVSINSGNDNSNSPAFLRGMAMVMIRYDQQFLLVKDRNEIAIELVHVVYNSDNQALGYIISRLDLERNIVPQLIHNAELIETYSYLATGDGEVITDPENKARALASLEAAPVQYIAGDQGKIEAHTVGDRKLITHYTSLPDIPLILVTEIDAEASFVQPLIDIFNQGPWVFLGVIALTSVLTSLVTFTITPALRSLQYSLILFGRGDFEAAIPAINRQDEIGDLAQAFSQSREQIQAVLIGLQERIANRVRDIQATQEVSRFAVSQRNSQELMNNVVNLIVDLFPNIYHAQIFLVDEDDNYAVLQASTGEAGQKLLSRGHRLQVGGVSVIGQVTEDSRVVVSRDTVASETHQKNEFLPDTRAELAIPLRVGDRSIGALDVQSKQSDSFDDDQISVLQTMADQIAVAIENATLYQGSLLQLEALRVTHQQTTGMAWREYMNFRRKKTFASEAGAPVLEDTRSLREQAIYNQQPAIGKETQRNTIPFAIPIQLRRQVLGAVEWELPTEEFTGDKLLLAQELVNRLAISLDNARLFQESSRAVNRERIVNEIAAHLTGQTDIDDILQTAVREVGRALGAPQVNINLKLSEDKQ